MTTTTVTRDDALTAPSFAAVHARRSTWHPGRVCSVRRIREAMTAESRAQLDAVLADTEHEPGAGIAASLRELGHDITPVTVNRHRRGECRCGGDQ